MSNLTITTNNTTEPAASAVDGAFSTRRLFTILTRPGTAVFAIAALCFMFSGNAKAQCGLAMGRRLATVRPDTRAIWTPPKAQAPPRVTSDDSKPGDDQNSSIVGLWHVTFTSGGNVVDEGFDIWNNGGTEVLNDTPPPASGNVCVGVWTKNGHVYKLKHPSWTFDEAGNLTGTAVIREEVTVDEKGNTFSGSFTVDVLDMSGTNLLHIDGDIKGTRITVD